jgi:hypothetical protein
MARLALLGAGCVLALLGALGGCVALVAGAGGGSVDQTLPSGPSDPPGAPAVPPAWEQLDQQAAAGCAGLPWAVLAGIGRIESDSARSSAPGVASGESPSGRVGPLGMRPGDFSASATTGPMGAAPPSPYDPVDAVWSAAAFLCARGGASTAGLAGAVAEMLGPGAVLDTVLVLAQALALEPALTSGPAQALQFAAAQLGTPYLWGGTGPGGFDCSGLVQAAYRAAGVSLPRVAQAQFDAGPALPATGTPAPGDLLFFGSSPRAIGHVGLYIGAGQMIDAPHRGATVRIEDAHWPDLVGATRPG